VATKSFFIHVGQPGFKTHGHCPITKIDSSITGNEAIILIGSGHMIPGEAQRDIQSGCLLMTGESSFVMDSGQGS